MKLSETRFGRPSTTDKRLEINQFKMAPLLISFSQHRNGYSLAKFTDTELRSEVVVAESNSQHMLWALTDLARFLIIAWSCRFFIITYTLSLKLCYERQWAICFPYRDAKMFLLLTLGESVKWPNLSVVFLILWGTAPACSLDVLFACLTCCCVSHPHWLKQFNICTDRGDTIIDVFSDQL